jgi:hypothetical protein
MKAFGSFEEWSALVRAAIVWATCYDPCETREELRASDPALSNLALLHKGWASLPHGSAEGLTIAEALELLNNSPARKYPDLRAAFLEWSRSDRLPGAGQVGYRFRSLRGRIVNGMRLESSMSHGSVQRWRVVSDGVPRAEQDESEESGGDAEGMLNDPLHKPGGSGGDADGMLG